MHADLCLPAVPHRHSDAVRHRHAVVLPDPRRAGRPVQPGARAVSPEIKANLEAQFGLGDPLWLQYLNYLNNLLHGNFGPSYNLPDFTVGELFAKGLPISVQLGASALILALIVGGALGIIAALNQNKLGDYAVIATATAGSTIPTFVIAPVIQLLFGLTWMLLPIGGWGDGALLNKIGPILTLSLPQIAIVARLMRGSMIESLRSHHIRTARALGLSDWSVVVTHALRGAVLPIVSYAGPAAAALLTGSVIVETIFAIPGVGRYFVDAALNRDYTLVMGTVVVIAHLHHRLQSDRRHPLRRRRSAGAL